MKEWQLRVICLPYIYLIHRKRTRLSLRSAAVNQRKLSVLLPEPENHDSLSYPVRGNLGPIDLSNTQIIVTVSVV